MKKGAGGLEKWREAPFFKTSSSPFHPFLSFFHPFSSFSILFLPFSILFHPFLWQARSLVRQKSGTWQARMLFSLLFLSQKCRERWTRKAAARRPPAGRALVASARRPPTARPRKHEWSLPGVRDLGLLRAGTWPMPTTTRASRPRMTASTTRPRPH